MANWSACALEAIEASKRRRSKRQPLIDASSLADELEKMAWLYHCHKVVDEHITRPRCDIAQVLQQIEFHLTHAARLLVRRASDSGDNPVWDALCEAAFRVENPSAPEEQKVFPPKITRPDGEEEYLTSSMVRQAAGGIMLLVRWCFFHNKVDEELKGKMASDPHLQFFIENSAQWLKERPKADSYLLGKLIPGLYTRHTGRKYTFTNSEDGFQAGGPAIRFAQVILRHMGIHKSPDAIAKAFTRYQHRLATHPEWGTSAGP